jgi:hypothetical protein
VDEMKKKKAKLQKDKLRKKRTHRPKARDGAEKRNKSVAGAPKNLALDSPMVENPDQGMEVMSNIIWDFAGPLLEFCKDEASERNAISVAILVWNSALLPEQERKETLDGYLAQHRDALPPEELETLSKLIDQLLEDKKTRFADNRNRITNCTFGVFGDDRRIEVGYSID